jgi:threonine/homoserine/homoserine lactone efflux protein
VTLALFAVTTLVLTATPGPAVLFVVGRTLEGGRRLGFAALLGVEAGEALYIAGAAAGITALIANVPLAVSLLRYAGAAYLLWLGARARFSRGESVPLSGAPGRRGSLLRGLLVQLLNPKVMVFFLAYFPLFVNGAQPTAAQVAVLGVIYIAIALMVDTTYVLLANWIGSRLRRSAIARARTARVSAVLYVVLGIVAAVLGDRSSSAHAAALAAVKPAA